MGLCLRITKSQQALKLYGFFVLLKCALEFAYATYSSPTTPFVYPFRFNPLKYIYGFFWFTILFFMIRHDKKQASCFFLEMLIAFQILPITVIYEMKDESTAYYTVICLALVVCEWIVSHLKSIRCDFRLWHIPQAQLMKVCLVSALVLFIFDVYRSHGLPTTMALNIYDVYKLRSSGLYHLSKYAAYTQDILMKVFIPVLLTRFVLYRRYVLAVCVYLAEFVIYLYSGHKLFLFIGLFAVGVTVLARYEGFVLRFWRYFCMSIAMFCLGVNLEMLSFTYFGINVQLFKMLYSMFVRRVMLVTASISFCYYDFFSTHPMMGLAGIFPTWLVPIENPYDEGGLMGTVPHLIGNIYFHSPAMGANNGFIGEGYERFGFIGIFIMMILLATILKLIDGFQEKTSYAFAIGCNVGVIFMLGDGQLLGPFFSYTGVWILFLLLYRDEGLKSCMYESSINLTARQRFDYLKTGMRL